MKSLYAFIQVRLNSSRLPGKAMLPIGDKLIIEHIIMRLHNVLPISNIAVVTSINSKDDWLASHFSSQKINVFRGSEENALERFYLAAEHFKADSVIRATGDNPFLDFKILNRMIENFDIFDYDYIGEGLHKTYPLGTTAEILSFNALNISNQNAEKASEREHITPYILKNPDIFKIKKIKFRNNLSNIRLTVDNLKDYEVAREVYDIMKKEEFCNDDLIKMVPFLEPVLKKNEFIKQKKII